MLKYSYVWQKLSLVARDALAGSGTIQERLLNAYVSGLIRLRPVDLPAEIQTAFGDVCSWLTRKSAGEEGAAAATILKLSTEQANYCVEAIIKMAAIVDHYYWASFGPPEDHYDTMQFSPPNGD